MTRLNDKIKEMAVFIEFLVGSGLAIFFHWVLEDPEVAYVTFGIGILLSLATYLIREDLAATRHALGDEYRQAHEIPFALARINDPECRERAQTLLAGTQRTLSLLQQGVIPLDETEFYLEGARCADQSLHRIRTVDPLSPGWGSRGAMVNFFQANLRALERGVAITRIFVVSPDELSDPDVQKTIATHLGHGIEVRVAFRDELPQANDLSGRDTSSPNDFAMYDDQIATEVYPQAGRYFGRKTTRQAEIERYVRLFELVEHNSQTVSMVDGQVYLASELHRLAS